CDLRQPDGIAAWRFGQAEGRAGPADGALLVEWLLGEPVQELELRIVEQIADAAHRRREDVALLQLGVELMLAARPREFADDGARDALGLLALAEAQVGPLVVAQLLRSGNAFLLQPRDQIAPAGGDHAGRGEDEDLA